MLSNLESEVELVRRHIKVLRLVVQKGPIGILKLSSLSGLPQHKVRYSLRVLEQGGIIRPSPNGAIPTPKADRFLKDSPRKISMIAAKLKELLR